MATENVWETCEIRLVSIKQKGFYGLFLGSRNYFFEATAIGPNGRYSAGEEKLESGVKNFLTERGDFHYNGPDLIPILHQNIASDKLNNLIKKLYADGWQSTGSGKEWYNQRFRRGEKK